MYSIINLHNVLNNIYEFSLESISNIALNFFDEFYFPFLSNNLLTYLIENLIKEISIEKFRIFIENYRDLITYSLPKVRDYSNDKKDKICYKNIKILMYFLNVQIKEISIEKYLDKFKLGAILPLTYLLKGIFKEKE